MPKFKKIPFYFNAMALALSLSFGAVIAVFVWYEIGVDRFKERSNDFHLATIEQTFRAKDSLFELEKRATAGHLPIGPPSITAGTRNADQSYRSLHLDRSLHVIGAAVASMAKLQQTFGGGEFEKTLNRIEVNYGTLSEFSNEVPPMGKTDRGDFIATIGALRLFLSQLERLHSIALADAKRVQDAYSYWTAAILVPLAAIMIILGVVTFRFLTAQVGLAVNQLERAEGELRLLNADLEQRVEARTAELRTAQDALVRKERLAALGQLTATVSHELRNPMGAMKNAIAAIKKLVGGKDERLTASLRIVDRSIGRCDAIIADLLDYTRLTKPELTLTAMDDWLAGVVDEYELPSGIGLDVDLQTGARLAIDRQRFHRAIFNLIDNACHSMLANAHGGETAEAGGEGQVLRVSSRLADGRLQVSVADTGPGIPPGDMEQIFEPLFSTKSFGVGLGLAMVKQIMEQHSGGIEVSRRGDRGAEFTLWLPLQAVQRSAAS